MSITAVTTASTTFSGDPSTAGTGVEQQTTNTDAPAIGAAWTALSSGANTITKPTSNTVYGVTIYPASGNTTQLTIKGGQSDTGLNIGLTSPTQMSLASGVVNFVLTAAAATTVKLVWW